MSDVTSDYERIENAQIRGNIRNGIIYLFCL